MKRTFTYLLIIVLFVCGKQGYDLLSDFHQIQSLHTGSLSDIAEEVVAIPLQDTGGYSIKNARYIRLEGNHLFLVSNRTLFHFNRSGVFIRRITNPEDIQVANYVINPVNQQLIVLGNNDDIFYYSYEGNLLSRRKLDNHLPNQHLLSLFLHKDRILTSEESIYEDPSTRISCVEKQVVEYDTSFRKIKTHKIAPVNMERSGCPINCLSPLVSVEKDSGEIYVYSPSMQPENLVRDTLYLRQKRQRQALANFTNTGALPLLPIRLGNRIWISSYYNPEDNHKNYMFCYDTKNDQSWQVKEGLKDNFYQTGTVSDLEAMDPYSHSYSFCKSGEAIKKAFPGQEESLILFIVKLKA